VLQLLRLQLCCQHNLLKHAVWHAFVLHRVQVHPAQQQNHRQQQNRRQQQPG
jgi:hypothetical protein